MDIVRRTVPASASILAAAGIVPALARVYAARGIASPAELALDFAGLPSWTALKGIDAAADRLARAVAHDEPLLIVADYDADGATACAVGVLGLRAFGARVDFLVPNRFEFGYGLTPEIVALAAERRPALIITVDNGIGSVEGVAAARARGIEVLITDHHLPGAELPATDLIVNPNQPGCLFPSRHLAGVGVMFYVLLALRTRLRERGRFAGRSEPKLAALLDLVALGTVADVVTLDRLNRILVGQGLRRIREGRMQPGVRALFAVAGRDPSRASAYELGFVVGPRLNAAGRLADMSVGIACLLAPDEQSAAPLAGRLDQLNRERRDVEATMQAQALDGLEATVSDDQYTICVYRPEWHQGVIGIVASRLKDRFHRPTIVFARGGESELRGSGRAIAGFHLRDALDLVAKRAPGIIKRFGGHAFAAGLTLDEDALPRFVAEFEHVARERLPSSALLRRRETDGELGAGELTLALARDIAGEVWGQGFPAPLFEGEFGVLEQRVFAGKHLRLTVASPNVGRLEAVVFDDPGPVPHRIRVTYRPEVNRFQDLESLQLVIDSWRPAQAEAGP
ncbi:MAG TPA: single-stranded-DNA-specific exonuclease RecJ [Casimicrobiaceae bacterium]|nr:single-stranded-DNA-specific exonuclease RecJ [Casimicrobiaceae bacterium]